MPYSPRPILILGIGNILLRDEGIGIRVIEKMQEIGLPEEIELLDGGTAGADLLDVLANREKIVVIDAIDADCEPGSVLRFGLDDLVQKSRPDVSLHELGVSETIAMTKHLGCAPKDVVVFGIKPRIVSAGLELSNELEGDIDGVIQLVLAEIGMSFSRGKSHAVSRNESNQLY
jgi:hydrogenase maturation protease